ncbi:sigma-70 family RNA polymerase sigma factor [Tissierella praeacuta]|uniref:RNA polymerase sigma factor n=1 Tax=Tissierella praeacuta TaxID=43131 RepID=UPI00333EC76E
MIIYLAMIENDSDKSKFERLYITYKQIMFYRAKEILRDSHLAEDAVHQAFINIIKNLDKIDENNCHKTKAFIVIVIENSAIDMYRKLKKEKNISIDDIGYEIKDMTYSAEDIFEENNESTIIKAIASLPLSYSLVIRLKYSHGYSNNEIAQILNINEDNVRKRLSRGKKKLAKILERLEIESYE